MQKLAALKDFDGWNKKKKETHIEDRFVIFYEREVWWCIMGINVGVEIDGKHELFLRPVVIVQKFNKNMALVTPTTDQAKNNKYYFPVSGEDGKNYNVCLSHIRSISSKRLLRKIGVISTKDYETLLEKIVEMIKKEL